MRRDFVPLAERVVDELLEADPARAYRAGDHRFDDRLPDRSDDAVRREVALLRRRAAELADVLAEVPASGLPAEQDVDRELLAAAVDARIFELTEIDERTWNPLLHIPGDLIFGLVAREVGPPAQRLVALAGRLAAVPDALASAERLLADCPRVHVETALGQLDGTASLVREQVPALLDRAPGLRGRVEPARAGALAAFDRHRDFLRRALPSAGRDPRLGRERFERRLRHALDSPLSAAEVLRRARDDLERVREEIRAAAAELIGRPDVRAALDRLAAEHPDARTIAAGSAARLAEATDFVRRHDIVTVPDDPIEIITMPEYARGVAVAYCDAPGPLETRPMPTFFAISPPPAGWSAERVASYYREYNDHMLANLAVHEAMPGHYLQLAHARRYRGSTRVRAVCASGTFVEGWAVYCEELMARLGFGGPPLRLQQLKMQLRMIINAILDQLVHCAELSEPDAMRMMTEQGWQEQSEAAGKWRRALLTSTQLSTYYVGYTEISAIARSRAAAPPGREWHDAMLGHGAPSPRHLRRLLGR